MKLSKKRLFKYTPITLILLFSAFLRLHKINAHMIFLGDQGRDVLEALYILRGDFTLLGPRASAGDFFLGPVYYYLIAPFLLIANYDPVGPAIMVALFGIATVFLIYYVSNDLFGKKAAITSSALYAISPLIVDLSRFSWNPNIVPFFAILTMYLLYKGVKSSSWKLLGIVGVLFGITLQLHYLATFLGAVIITYIFVSEFVYKKSFVKKGKNILFNSIYVFVGFLIGFSPFLAFELRHNFPNSRTIFSFIFENAVVDEYATPLNSFQLVVSSVVFRLFARTLLAYPQPDTVSTEGNLELQLGQYFTYILIPALLIAIFFVKGRLKITLLNVWLIVGVLLFGFYKRSIHDYYLAFLFPVPFLLFGNLIQKLSSLKKYNKLHLGKLLGAVVIAVVLYFNYQENPLKTSGNNQKLQMQTVSEFVLEKTNNNPYNFALISGGNTDHTYRYYFELNYMPPVTIEPFTIDPERTTVTDQLFVICEMECNPIGHSLWEIAGFGQAEIDKQWHVTFFDIYRLVPANNEQNQIKDNQESTEI